MVLPSRIGAAITDQEFGAFVNQGRCNPAVANQPLASGVPPPSISQATFFLPNAPEEVQHSIRWTTILAFAEAQKEPQSEMSAGNTLLP